MQARTILLEYSADLSFNVEMTIRNNQFVLCKRVYFNVVNSIRSILQALLLLDNTEIRIRNIFGEPSSGLRVLGDRIFRETSVPGNARGCGSGEATAIWSFRHYKPAASILGPTGANMWLSLICGFLC